MTFIANVAIMIHHANLKSYYPDKVTEISLGIMNFFSVVAVPAMVWFFFISAYLFFRNLDLQAIPPKWKRRICSIVIPYIIWNTLSVILELAKGGNIMNGGVLHFIVKNYLFVHGVGCANGPLWYLFRLIEYLIMAPLIFYVVRNKWYTVASVFALLTANYILRVGYFDISYFLPVYIAGAYAGINMPEITEGFFSGKDIQHQQSRVVGFVFGVMIIIGFGYAVYALPEPWKS